METKTMIILRKGALGDVLMMTPAVREYRLRNPKEYIGIRTLYPEVFANSPYVDEVSDDLTRGGEKVLHLDGVYEKDMDRHPVNVYAREIVGTASFSGKHLELFPTDKDRQLVDQWWAEHIKEEDRVVVLHFGTTWVKMEGKVLDKLIKELSKSWRVILIGRPDPAREYYPAGVDGFIDLVGHPWNIHMLHWLIQKADMFFGTDTGPLHIAATTSTPIVGCFSFVNPDYRVPYRDGVAFEAVGKGNLCNPGFCAQKRKIKTPTGDFIGVTCDYEFKCSRDITTEMIMKKINITMEAKK